MAPRKDTVHDSTMPLWRELLRLVCRTTAVVLAVLGCLPVAVEAQSGVSVNACVGSFPNGVQSISAAGQIYFDHNAQMLNGSGPGLLTYNLARNPSSTAPTCGSEFCYKTDAVVDAYNAPPFIESTSTTNTTVGFGSTRVLGADGATQFGTVTVQYLGKLSFSPINSAYAIRRLVVNYQGQVTLPPGDYWIGELQLDADVRIAVAGEGTVRLFVRDGATIGWLSRINSPGAGQEGDAGKLLLHSYAGITVANNVTLSGLVSAAQQVVIDYQSKVFGAVTAAGIRLNTGVAVNYRPGAVTALDFGGICDIDGDGTYDGFDPDRDGDGYSNEEEIAGGSDPDNPDSIPGPDGDGDGIPDDVDPDRDGDGIDNDQDAFPNDPNESSDTDGDGIGDNSDPDRDGDGVDNASDAFPDDAAEWSDIDSDSIGDNSDPDRDGDGFSNSDEQTAGTNPNDGADYPDTVPPALTVSLSSPQTIEADVITVTGTVTDPTQPYSGVTSLQIISDRFPGSPFSGAIDGNQFSVEVPLRVEINTLTITAQDASGNSAQASLVVDRISPPRFVNVTPLSGTVVTTDSISIAGEVHTLLPLTDVQFYINEWQITPDGTETVGSYRFVLPNIPLQYGDNNFALRAIASDGEAVSNLMVRYWPSDADELPAPVITIQSPAPNSLLSEASFRLAARVESAGGPLQIAVNGESQPLPRPDLTALDFSKLMTFADGQNTLGVVIEATDSLGKTSTVTASYQRDALSPVITINNSLMPSPGINPVLESPYLISGTVVDENLANFMVNDAPLALRPGAEPSTYTFTFAVALSSGEQLPLNFAARDFSGNLSELEVILQSQAAVGIEALLPADQATFIAGTESLAVQTVARTSQLQAGDTVAVSIDGGSAITATLSGDLATADMNLPTSSGTYNIQWRVVNALNEVIATTSRTVKVTQDSDIPVQLLRMEPASNDRYAEPNAPIEFYFNKHIDLSLLTVTLRETLHGDTYINTDPAGLDFLQAKGYQLEEVHRDREVVPGSLQLLPGDTSAAFYADRMLGFGAEIFVDVSYDGQSLARQQFRVRELPTFVIGGVIDQFGQPLQGVTVSLPDLGRNAVTNGDGSFAFGFQEAADQVIPGGRHRLVINGNLATAGFGSELRTVNLQQHRRNELEVIKLQELNPDLPKQLIEGARQLSLVGNDLRVNLNNARLRFPDGRNAGIVHTQFVSFEEVSVTSPPSAMPHWLFASQPRGIAIEGAVELDMAMPPLRGSYDYAPTELYQYVVLLGYNADAEVLEPVGVGRIENHRVTSVGPVAMTSFDFFGYALVDPSNTALLEAVANGQVSLQQLKAQLQ